MAFEKYEKERISKRMWRVVIVICLVGLVFGHSLLMSRNSLGIDMEIREWSGSYTAHMVIYR